MNPAKGQERIVGCGGWYCGKHAGSGGVQGIRLARGRVQGIWLARGRVQGIWLARGRVVSGSLCVSMPGGRAGNVGG